MIQFLAVRSEAAAVYQFLEASMMNACMAGKGKRRIGQRFYEKLSLYGKPSDILFDSEWQLFSDAVFCSSAGNGMKASV